MRVPAYRKCEDYYQHENALPEGRRPIILGVEVARVKHIAHLSEVRAGRPNDAVMATLYQPRHRPDSIWLKPRPMPRTACHAVRNPSGQIGAIKRPQ